MKYVIEESTLKSIADAIRTKTNSSENMLVSNMANNILSIENGSSNESNVSENGLEMLMYTPKSNERSITFATSIGKVDKVITYCLSDTSNLYACQFALLSFEKPLFSNMYSEVGVVTNGSITVHSKANIMAKQNGNKITLDMSNGFSSVAFEKDLSYVIVLVPSND